MKFYASRFYATSPSLQYLNSNFTKKSEETRLERKNTSRDKARSPASENSFVKSSNISNKDKKKGTATGVKIVSNEEVDKIRKENNLNTSNKPLDGISYPKKN